MIEKTLTELKSIAAELGIVPDGDKRLKDTWIRAIHSRGITVVEPCFDKEKSPLEREREKLPLGARVALMCEPKPQPEPEPEPEEPPTEPWPFPPLEENFVPKFHEISISDKLRYRYANEGIFSDWIYFDGPIEELKAALKEIEEGLQGILVYRGYKVQVSPLLELFYKIPDGTKWFNFPLNENEDIQEGIRRINSWIDSLIELWGEPKPDNFPIFSTIFKQIIYETIPQEHLTEFRRNCTPIAIAPRPP